MAAESREMVAGEHVSSGTHVATDHELMRRVAAADEAALADLYDRYGRLVMSVALGVVGDRATAEEITLDIFLRVWHNAAGYDPSLAKVSTWLTRMARNRAIDQLRREAVRPSSHSVMFDDTAIAYRSPGDMDTVVDLSLTRQRVRAAVASLPVEQRQALALAFFQGYTHSEIAGLLEQSLGTVKGRIRGGMARLRLILAADAIPNESLRRNGERGNGE
jgi:RNA polymerase sigma-70 factor (ECF subfamily)